MDASKKFIIIAYNYDPNTGNTPKDRLGVYSPNDTTVIFNTRKEAEEKAQEVYSNFWLWQVVELL